MAVIAEVESKILEEAARFQANPKDGEIAAPWSAPEGTAIRGPLRPTGVALLDAIVATVKPDLRYGGNEAGTTWPHDGSKPYIAMPEPESFRTPADYAKTLAHELVHWTQPKLGRIAGKMSGFDMLFNIVPEGYAQEELVAELGASLLLAEGGADVDYTSAGEYVGSWILSMDPDTRAAQIAAAKEQAKAAVAWLKAQVAA